MGANGANASLSRAGQATVTAANVYAVVHQPLQQLQQQHVIGEVCFYCVWPLCCLALLVGLGPKTSSWQA
jgi:hypothetical protein